MRPVSSRWAATIPASHKISVAVVVIEPDGTETPLTPEDGDDGSLTEGTVTLEATAAVRGRCSLTVEGVRMAPDSADALLAPYSNEVRIERGYETPDGYVERVVLGHFRIEDSTVDAGPGRCTISINGLDRAQRMIDAKFEDATSIPAGTPFEDAIRTLLEDGGLDPDLIDFPETGRVTPLLVFSEEGDRWQDAQNMAQAIGMELYFNADGICVLVPYNPGSPVAEIREASRLSDGSYDPDDTGATLLTVSRAWTRQGAFNKVIAKGQNADTDEIYRAEAKDDDPDSPTYYHGPFGQVPRFYESEYIISNEQAQDAAETILAKELGTTQQVNFGAIVNPALEPNDVVSVRRDAIGISDSLIIESLTIPLSGGEMTGTTKSITV